MAHKYAQIVFTNAVRQVQIERNSRKGYSSMDQGEDYNHLLSETEAMFIAQRDSFYMASVSETNWPYVQHRGGAKGFVRVLDASTIGFADFSGNRQYVSTGNFRGNDRVALFFMDYPSCRRLKMMGRITQVADDDWETMAMLEVDDHGAVIERAFIIKIEAFDWNCPQYITPRYTELEVQQMMAPLLEENKALKAAQQSGTVNTYPKISGKGELPLIITGVRQLTPRVRAFELRHRDGDALPLVQAGAHLQIPVLLDSGETVLRHYSICSNPVRRDMYEIAVLKKEDGQGGSATIHENLQLGMVLNCSGPHNFFQLHEDDRPAVLIAGGIGITPIKPMAQTLKNRGALFEIHYAGRSLRDMAFQDRLRREFGERLRFYPADKNERIRLNEVLRQAPDDAVFYACGPQALLDQLVNEAEQLGIQPERVRFERFSSLSVVDAKPFSVELAKTGKRISVEKDQSLLDAVLEAGIELPHSCKSGECKSCAVKVLEGEVDHQDNCLTDAERNQQKIMCPCVSRSHGEYLVIDV